MARLRTCASAVAFVIAAGTAGATAAASEPAIAAAVVSDDHYPVVPARFADGVIGYPDLVYATIPGFQPLKLDVYAGEATAGAAPRPLVIYIHGGAWMGGHSRAAGAFQDFPVVLASLAARGYVVASINYRLSGEARFPAALQDAEAAIRYLRAHADRFGIDRRRVILWGSSAGGELAALIAGNCDRTASEASDCIQGAVIWYGAFDLAEMEPPAAPGAPPSPAATYLGCDPRSCPDVAAQASPINHVNRGSAPMLIMHGLEDRTISAEQSRRMASRLRDAGVRVETLFIPDVGHSWIGNTPEATRQASLAALARTFAFIDAVSARTR